MSKIAAILPAAGLGTRMGAETPKQFLELDGAPILVHSLRKIASCELITDIIVATRAEEVARLAERLRAEKFRQTLRVVKGGDTRHESVAAALKHVAEGTEIVLVHDAVRPFVTREQIARVIEEARKGSQSMSLRVGIGYDLHRLEAGRKLIIGGVDVPFDKGPVGHSDGDVLAHALCDALLGAAGLGDIGTHFPDTDPKWKGANSLIFLEHAKKLLAERDFVIEHVDAVVIMEKPKLGPHFPKMREALARALGVPAEKIHLKAKTNEGVDAVGRGEAIAAHVVATLALRQTAQAKLCP